MNDVGVTWRTIDHDGEKWVMLSVLRGEQRHYRDESEKLRNLCSDLERSLETQVTGNIRRDIATMAMIGLQLYKVVAGTQTTRAHDYAELKTTPIGFAPPPPEVVASMAVKYADALIAALAEAP